MLGSDSSRSIAESVYIVISALKQNPDPDRIRSANDHISEMIADNRIFWACLAEETDNDREWSPSAT